METPARTFLGAGPGPGGKAVAEVNGVEPAIPAVVADVLGPGSVGLSASIFGLGGDSLAALEVTRRLIEDLGRDVPLDVLVDPPDFAVYTALVEALPSVDA